MIVSPTFFDREPLELVQSLIGKLLRHRINHPAQGDIGRSAKITETEVYRQKEEVIHPLGLPRTPRRVSTQSLIVSNVFHEDLPRGSLDFCIRSTNLSSSPSRTSGSFISSIRCLKWLGQGKSSVSLAPTSTA